MRKEKSPKKLSVPVQDSGATSLPLQSCNNKGLEAVISRHALSIILFFISLFFIIGVSNPALYTNDEWITANQLHQLAIGHQVTFNEGKYGVTANGTVSAYFTSRQNILLYSLALPVAALPAVKLFGLLGDNFRLIVIFIWSLCLIFAALLIDEYFPAYSRVYGIRILFPAIILSFLLFMGNILFYKQFPFSAPDAPFEVAALVLTNHLLFALTVAVIFETSWLILKDTWMALFCTCSCIACSSYIFWAATAKDHMLTAAVFAFCIYLFIRFVEDKEQRWHAFLSFMFCGILVWIRPEIGLVVTCFTGILFIIPPVGIFVKREITPTDFLVKILPVVGVFFGMIPFFINNYLINQNWLLPAFDLPQGLAPSGTVASSPVALNQVLSAQPVPGNAAGLSFFETITRLIGMASHLLISGSTVENTIRGFFGILLFPQNGSIGFLIMCPLAVLALLACIFWTSGIIERSREKREVLIFLGLMILSVFLSYLTKFGSMNISHGVLPDMRYLSPAYIPASLLSIMIFRNGSLLKKPRELFSLLLKWTPFVVLFLIVLMIIVHPFGNTNEGYMAFFKFIILCEIVLGGLTLTITRFYPDGKGFMLQTFPLILAIIIMTMFSFQFMLSSIYAMVIKFNGYPFWLPIVREGFRMFINVNYLSPV